MARIKLAYIGGGSTRAPGTMASFIAQGENFAGSEVVLIDLDRDKLGVVKTLAETFARNRDLDLTVTTTTDRRAGLADCDAVLTSYRPGGLEARIFDERIPLRHGVIGQETQGPGGFFMALRSIHVMQGIVEDMEDVCPGAWLINYTNPINIVAQAVADHSSIPFVALCEGPIVYPASLVEAAGLDPAALDVVSIGLNHASWSVRHRYHGHDVMPLLQDAWEQMRDDPQLPPDRRRQLQIAVAAGSIPSEYFQYYYFTDEILAELRSKPSTRAEDILSAVPDYWTHYREQAASPNPAIDPSRSRGGIHELELALDVLDAIFNDRREVLPVNVPNRGAIANLPDDLVVECRGFIDSAGVTPLADGSLPRHLAGLVSMLGEYQASAARAAWEGTRRDAVRALASNPLCRSFELAETIYGEMAAAFQDFLPERLQ